MILLMALVTVPMFPEPFSGWSSGCHYVLCTTPSFELDIKVHSGSNLEGLQLHSV
jgi:hypothetical protein